MEFSVSNGSLACGNNLVSAYNLLNLDFPFVRSHFATTSYSFTKQGFHHGAQ